MHREIKFRYWHDKYKIMNYSDSVGLCNLIASAIRGKIPIQQYVNMKDKNGKEIYEGDILKYSSSVPVDHIHYTDKVIVKFTDESHDNYPGFITYGSYNHHGQPEIVGNIYENPELLDSTVCNNR